MNLGQMIRRKRPPPSRLGARGVTRRFGPVVANDGNRLRCEARNRACHRRRQRRRQVDPDAHSPGARPSRRGLRPRGRRAGRRSPVPPMPSTHGIGMVHQEFMLVPGLTLLENLVLSHEPVDRLGRIDRARALEAARGLERQAGVELDWDMIVDRCAGPCAPDRRDPSTALPGRRRADPGRTDRGARARPGA